MSYILLSFLAAFFFAFSQVFNKFVIKHKIKDKNSLMVYFMVTSLLFSLILFPFTSKILPPTETLWNIFIATTAFLIGYYLFFFGIADTDASTFAPFFQLQAAMIAFLAYVFLGERFPFSNYFFIGIIILGVILVSSDEKMELKFFLKKGILFILAVQVFHAVSNLFVGFSLQKIGFMDMLFWECAIIGVYTIPFYLITRPKINYPTNSIVCFGIATFLSSFGALFLFKAFEQNLTISSTISLMSSPIVFIITVLASKFKPDLLEHHSIKIYAIRGIGLIFILFGVLKLSLGQL